MPARPAGNNSRGRLARHISAVLLRYILLSRDISGYWYRQLEPEHR
jgi:hypothetical protein